jgi:hypothetical protein
LTGDSSLKNSNLESQNDHLWGTNENFITIKKMKNNKCIEDSGDSKSSQSNLTPPGTPGRASPRTTPRVRTVSQVSANSELSDGNSHGLFAKMI